MLNPKITAFAEKYDISREAAGMGLHMLKDDFLKLDEHVYHPEVSSNTLWRTDALLGVLKTCERAGLFGDPGFSDVLASSMDEARRQFDALA